MAYSYGSVTKAPRGTYKFAKPVQPKEHSSGLTGLFRILIVIAEVGISLLMPEGAVAAQIGLGLATAGANTALSASEGALTGVGLGIDFGSALIPGIGAAKYANRIGKSIASETATLAEAAAISSIRTMAEKETSSILKTFGSQYRKNLAKGNRLISREIKGQRKAVAFAKRLSEGKLNEADKILISVMESHGGTAEQVARDFERLAEGNLGRDIITNAKEKIQYQLRAYKHVKPELLQKAADEARELQEAFDAIKHLPISKRSSESVFLKNAEKIAGKDKVNLFREIYINPIRKTKGAQEFALAKATAITKFNSIERRLSEEGKDTFRALTRQLQFNAETIDRGATSKFFSGNRFTGMNKKELSKFADDIVKSMSSSDQRIIKELLGDSELASTAQLFGHGADINTTRRLVKKLGTKDFNDKFVQRAQLIDPNDLGRYGPERMYQFLKEKLDKKIEKNVFRKAGAKGKALLKDAKEIEDAFVKSGGTLFPPNRYIIGMKVLGGPINSRLVLIKFNKLNTSTKKAGKNHNGKKDLIIRATDADIERLRLEGKNYWFAVGRRKGWFVSRGGKTGVSGSVGTISNNLSLFLGFVPIPALRNVLSIVSNWVENVSDMARGDYFGNYISKLERALFRTTINRSVRLTTRYIIGGKIKARIQANAQLQLNKHLQNDVAKAADKIGWDKELLRLANKSKYGGQWFGRELQRIGSTLTSAFETTDSSGHLAFKSRSAGYIAKRFATTAIPVAARGGILRHGNRRGKTLGRQLVSSKRNTGQIMRVYSAFTPNSAVKPLRSLTKF